MIYILSASYSKTAMDRSFPCPMRLQEGRSIRNQDATAADTVALLSGVNLGSVVKVFAALEALAGHLAIEADDLVHGENVPLSAPRFDGTDAHRVDATRQLAERVASDPRCVHLDDVLHMSRRITARSGARTVD